MTQGGPDQRTLLRAVLATVVVVDLVSFFFFLGEARSTAAANGIEISRFAELFSRTIVRGVIVLIGVVSAVAFGWRPGRLWEGLLSLGALTVLSTAHAQLFGSPWRHLFYSGVCLSGWLLGLVVSRRRGAPLDESYARVGSIALLGAAYFNAGISKIVFGGAAWMSGLPIQATIIGQVGLVPDGIVGMYRSRVVMTPAVASLFSVATTAVELAGPLMLVGRRTRLCVALGLIAMHANIFVLTHIAYWESMVFLLAFGLSADAPDAETVPESAGASRLHGRAFVGGAALLALCAFFAIGHQSRRFARLHGLAGAEGEAPAPPPLAFRHIGPFSVGQTLADEWSLDSLTNSEEGFIASLSGARGQAAFEITCSPSAHRSPFDFGPAHIFYSSQLEFHDLDALGQAFREEIREATNEENVCEKLADWRKTVATLPAP